MIVARTPFRISFAGGGTDIPSFYRAHGGAVLSMAIDKYFYLTMHRAFLSRGYLLKYAKTEAVQSVEDIEHPIIRQVFADYGISGVDFSSAADIPAGTGLGSSSAFTAGLISLCNAYKGHYAPAEEVAAAACRIEIDRLGEPIGKQDQYGCAIGGLKLIEFHQDERVVVTPIFLTHTKRQALEDSLVLAYVGGHRSASQMLRQQGAEIAANPARVDDLKAMASLAHQLRGQLQEDPTALGAFLHEGWERKRRLSATVSTPFIDAVYERGRAAGATGGKLLGAGGGGFVLFCAPGATADGVRAALSDLPLFSVKIDGAGSVIVYDDMSHLSAPPIAPRAAPPFVSPMTVAAE